MNRCTSLSINQSIAQPWIHSFFFKSGFFDSGGVDTPGFLSSSSPPREPLFLSLFHCSSYKYAEMKYTLLLVVNDVLWYSLRLWIVLCLLCMMYSY